MIRLSWFVAAMAAMAAGLTLASCRAGTAQTSGFAAGDIPAPHPLIANGAWASVLKGGHPRLLGSKAYLVALAQAKPAGYQEVKSINDDVRAAGVVCAVEGLPKEAVQPWIDRAMSDVARGVTNEHQDTWIWLTQVAEAYDFFYDQISPADRGKMVDFLNAHLGEFTIDEGAFHNSTLSKVLCYLKVAYATWGDNPRASEFRDYAIQKLYEGKLVPVLNEFGAGGGYTECGWYTRGSLWNLVEGLEMARRIGGYDGFQKAPRFFYDRLAYEMLQPYPGLFSYMYGAEQYAMEGDGSNIYGGHVEYPRHTRDVLSQYFRGSELSGYLTNKRRSGSNGAARLVDFLYQEQPDPALPLKDFPLAHIATGIGKVYARGDWTDDASWLRFECGDYWNGHQHFEVGNFEIFRYEPLATESGEYIDYGSNHDVNWLTRTIAHNSMLVYMPGEQWKDMRDGGRNKYANDGGQAKKWDWTRDNLAEWEKERATFERGKIVAFQNTPAYMYVAGDCTKAYTPQKLSKWIRQIVFLRPHTFVIFDRVVSTKPEYKKTWLLHSRFEPTITGNSTYVKNGKGELFVQTLLPENPVISKIEGYTYGGMTFDPDRKTALSDKACLWRMEVSPSKARNEDLFMTVLSTDQAPQVKLVRKGTQVGVRVGNAEVMFSGDAGGTLTIGGRTTPLEAKVVTNEWQ